MSEISVNEIANSKKVKGDIISLNILNSTVWGYTDVVQIGKNIGILSDESSAIAVAKSISTKCKFFGGGIVLFNSVLTIKDDSKSTEEKVGNIAVDVGTFALSWGAGNLAAMAAGAGGVAAVGVGTLAVVAVGTVLTVASLTLTDEQMEAIGDAILTTPDRWQSELLEEINAETADLQVFTADEITAMLDSQGFNGAELWNNFCETLTNIFQAQVEMEMAFEGYLPKNIDTTNVYAKGITSQCDPIVLDLNGNQNPQSFAGQMPAPLRKGRWVSSNFYFTSFEKAI